MLNEMNSQILHRKKISLVLGMLLIMIIARSTSLFATDYEVSGAGMSEVNGTYVENGTYNGKPKYELNGTNYEIRYNDMMFSRWEIWNTGMWETMYYTNEIGDTPPSTGWVSDRGEDPAPSVMEAGPMLSYDTDTFLESEANDGSIENTITITLTNPEGITFSGSNGTFSSSNYTSANVPSGLTLVITKDSDTELQVNLTGNASSHTNNDDVNDLTITFLDAAFNGGTAADVSNSSKNDLFVDYYYEIATLADLQTLSNTQSDWDERIIQTADIDASATATWDDGDGGDPEGFTPIAYGYDGNFTGGYNGNNHTIDGLFIDRTDCPLGVGLFATLDEQAFILNLGLTNVNVTGDNDFIGGLVGLITDDAFVRNAYSTGTVTGSSESAGVGGLVGFMRGNAKIEQSYSHCDVSSGERIVGGLTGGSNSTSPGPMVISNSYSTGDVTRTAGSGTDFGSFCGYAASYLEITNCYSTGSVFESDGVAWSSGDKGFLGGGSLSDFSANFFDSDASNQSTATSATAKTTSEMKTQSTFTNAGWDFTTVWQMIGTNYPDLRDNHNPALPVGLISFTASLENDAVILNWKTASEVNAIGFILDRKSENEPDWRQIASYQTHPELVCLNNQIGHTEYSFTDDNIEPDKSYSYRLSDVDVQGNVYVLKEIDVNTTGVEEFTGMSLPEHTKLLPAFPNPFNPTTTINFSLSENQEVQVRVFDVTGRQVALLVDEPKNAGYHQVQWNAADMSSGVYFIQMEMEKFQTAEKCLLMK